VRQKEKTNQTLNDIANSNRLFSWCRS